MISPVKFFFGAEQGFYAIRNKAKAAEAAGTCP